MASGGGVSAAPALRRKIEPWEFTNFFDPMQLRKEAYLLYRIKWSRKSNWKHTSRNTAQHVEVDFIERLTRERHLSPSASCSITWYLSWSPCWECSRAIREFVTQHPRVTLVIYVSRLYWHMKEQNRRGLRDLMHSGVTVQAMTASEYEYCWRNFVNYSPDEDQCPRYSPLFMVLYLLELRLMFLGLPPCFKIVKRRPDAVSIIFLKIIINQYYGN